MLRFLLELKFFRKKILLDSFHCASIFSMKKFLSKKKKQQKYFNSSTSFYLSFFLLLFLIFVCLFCFFQFDRRSIFKKKFFLFFCVCNFKFSNHPHRSLLLPVSTIKVWLFSLLSNIHMPCFGFRDRKM